MPASPTVPAAPTTRPAPATRSPRGLSPSSLHPKPASVLAAIGGKGTALMLAERIVQRIQGTPALQPHVLLRGYDTSEVHQLLASFAAAALAGPPPECGTDEADADAASRSGTQAVLRLFHLCGRRGHLRLMGSVLWGALCTSGFPLPRPLLLHAALLLQVKLAHALCCFGSHKHHSLEDFWQASADRLKALRPGALTPALVTTVTADLHHLWSQFGSSTSADHPSAPATPSLLSALCSVVSSRHQPASPTSSKRSTSSQATTASRPSSIRGTTPTDQDPGNGDFGQASSMHSTPSTRHASSAPSATCAHPAPVPGAGLPCCMPGVPQCPQPAPPSHPNAAHTKPLTRSFANYVALLPASVGRAWSTGSEALPLPTPVHLAPHIITPHSIQLPLPQHRHARCPETTTTPNMPSALSRQAASPPNGPIQPSRLNATTAQPTDTGSTHSSATLAPPASEHRSPSPPSPPAALPPSFPSHMVNAVPTKCHSPAPPTPLQPAAASPSLGRNTLQHTPYMLQLDFALLHHPHQAAATAAAAAATTAAAAPAADTPSDEPCAATAAVTSSATLQVLLPTSVPPAAVAVAWAHHGAGLLPCTEAGIHQVAPAGPASAILQLVPLATPPQNVAMLLPPHAAPHQTVPPAAAAVAQHPEHAVHRLVVPAALQQLPQAARQPLAAPPPAAPRSAPLTTPLATPSAPPTASAAPAAEPSTGQQNLPLNWQHTAAAAPTVLCPTASALLRQGSTRCPSGDRQVSAGCPKAPRGTATPTSTHPGACQPGTSAMAPPSTCLTEQPLMQRTATLMRQLVQEGLGLLLALVHRHS